jgi:hypothetical protein
MHRNEVLALVQAQAGYRFATVKFFGPRNSSGDFVGNYSVTGKEYVYKIKPNIGVVDCGDLLVVPAQDGFAIVEVQSVSANPPQHFKWETVKMRVALEKVHVFQKDRDDQEEAAALAKMAEAEVAQRLSDAAKFFDLKGVQSLFPLESSEKKVF